MEDGDDSFAAVDVSKDASGSDKARKCVAVVVGVGRTERIDADQHRRMDNSSVSIIDCYVGGSSRLTIAEEYEIASLEGGEISFKYTGNINWISNMYLL